MNRHLQASLATAAVASIAIVAPIVANAASSSAPTPAACAPQQSAVAAAHVKVAKDTKALAAVGKRAHHRAQQVSRAKKKLKEAQAALDAAQGALTDCSVLNQPRPTATATATVTTTATATPAPLSFVQGTARLTETRPDLSAIPPIGYWDGVALGGTGFGSAWTADPAHPGYFYGLTDRGPNVTAPDGTSKLEPMAGFQDAIGYFHQVGGTLQLVKTIGLTLPNGTAMSGLVNTSADTGEKIIDQYGNTLPKAASGFDSEGLVVLPDGTFWVSDEYGPFVVHFDATGKELSRFDPYASAATSTVNPLPAELKKRRPNRGMEGLTVTNDGKYLVGIMQSSLEKNAGSAVTPTSSAAGSIARIVKISLSDPTDIRQYLYYLHGGASDAAGEAASEITAVPGGNGNTFIVDERDGKFEGTAGGAVKNLWRIDLSSATDVGSRSPLIGTTVSGGQVTYDATAGLLIGGKTIEDLAGTKAGADAATALAATGVNTGAESLYLDYAGLLTAIDPSGMYFGHDKVEGVSFDPANPHLLQIANDSDFGITDLPKGADPDPTNGDTRAIGTRAQKFLPDGRTQDFGEVLVVDMTQVPAAYKG